MAYTISFTDETNKGTITVEDNTINQSLSVGLVGRNSIAFGQIIAENALHMLENFALDTPPDSPVEGQLWYDTTPTNEQLKVYDGTNWIASGGLKKANTAPDVSSSVAGDLWADTDNQQLYLFTGSGWLLVGPQFSKGLTTGIEPVTVIDTANIDHTVLDIKVRANTFAIIATEEFTPKAAMLGFNVIKPGINLSAANLSGQGISKYIGISEKAESLIVGNEVVSSSSFLRNDVVSTTDFAVRIKNNGGLIIGNSLPLSISVEGEAAVISHNTAGANIDIRVNNGGQITTPIRINSDTNVGINNTNPTESLDVIGNIKTDSALLVNGVTESTNFGNGSIIAKGGIGVAKKLNVGGDLKISGTSTFANVMPDTATTSLFRNLGADAARWDNVYANNFRGSLVGNVTGTVSGRSGSADRLTSSTQFRMTGDVTAAEFAFDGTVGGNIKTFTTSISNTFISAKPAVGSTVIDDEILINRTSGSPGLYRVSRANFFKSIPTTPIGLISPYGGKTAPPGYFLCDGAEKSKAVNAELFAIIGFSFLDPTLVSDGGVTLFAMPDFRGRFPLGLDDMGTDQGAANRVTSPSADVIGSVNGSESKDVTKDNLPEHEHDLRTPNGDQYYVIRDIPIEASSDPAAIPIDSPTSSQTGSAASTSGGLIEGGQTGFGDYRTVDGELLGNKLDVMNPYQAVNYIIYHGVFT
jgi:microcystin-dependent protein/cytoskeletal protein CcmA (bactofilin family)